MQTETPADASGLTARIWEKAAGCDPNEQRARRLSPSSEVETFEDGAAMVMEIRNLVSVDHSRQKDAIASTIDRSPYGFEKDLAFAGRWLWSRMALPDATI